MEWKTMANSWKNTEFKPERTRDQTFTKDDFFYFAV